MWIRRLRLTNLRSHRSTVLRLQPGINVVQGLNGVGKSTVVDALGFALFDGIPEGSDPVHWRRELIRRGAVTAEVVLELQRDDVRYQLRRLLTGSGQEGPWELRDHEGVVLLQGGPQVLGWLREAMGIERIGMGALFANIPGAFQGQLTAPFEKGGHERRDFFESALGVARWRRMGERLRELAEDALRDQALEPLEQRMDELRGRVALHRGVASRLASANEERELASSRLRAAEERFRVAQAEVKRTEQRQALLEELERARESVSERVRALRGSLEEAAAAERRSVDAAASCDEHELGHDVYMEQREIVVGFEREERQRRRHERRHAAAELARVGLAAQLDAIQERWQRDRQRIEQRRRALATREAELAEQLVTLSEAAVAAEEALGARRGGVHAGRVFDHRVEALHRACRHAQDLLRSWEAAGRGVVSDEALRQQREALSGAEGELVALGARLSEAESLREAALSAGCPVLEAPCPHPSADTLVERLQRRCDALREARDLLQRRLEEELRPGVVTAAQRNRGWRRFDALREHLGSELRAAVWELADFDRTALQLPSDAPVTATLEAPLTALRSWAERAGDVAQTEAHTLEILALWPELGPLRDSLETALQRALQSAEAVSRGAQRELDRLEGERESLRAQRERMDAEAGEVEDEQEEIGTLEGVLLDATEEVAQERDSLSPFEGIDQRLAEARRALETYQQDFLAWERARPDAIKLEERRTRVAECRRALGEATQELEDIDAQLQALQESVSDASTGEAGEELTRSSEAQRSAESRFARLDERVAELQARAAEVEAWEQELEEIAAQHARHQRSYDLATAVAAQVLDRAGPQIAADLTARVSGLAAEVYEDIAQDAGGRLAWSAEDFRVVLDPESSDGPLAFSQLSGGQQAVAALALRLALFRVAARRVGFVCLDEPTAQLDRRRRASLAEALSALWLRAGVNPSEPAGDADGGERWLEQVILTTHDDAFEELPVHRITLGLDASGNSVVG